MTTLARLLDAFSAAFVCGYCAYALASVELLPSPFGIVLAAALGAVAVLWLVR